jgi:catecholate siderophore receptor
VTITAGYEHFNDHRTADRGVPSFDAHPFDAVSTFFGDPRINVVNATVDAGDLTIAYIGAPGLTIRNHSRWAAYDKFYQNVFPGGAVDSTGTQVNLSAYNNAARRHNLFNQTDVTYVAQTAGIQHTLLAGVELGRQVTNNFKNTGYFNNSSTSLTVPVDAPSVDVPVTFRQSATDADNHNVVIANSLYAQDQVALTPTLQLVAGVRGQLFDQTYHNNRGDTTYRRTDRLIAPRAGLVFKPVDDLALYANYGISYLPSSGDQFSSLTSITQAMEPEKFTSLEAGAKWQPTDRLSLTAATYRLARTNTRAADPTDPTRFVQTGESRSTGVELSAFGTVTNRWQIAGQYTNQVARIVSRTTAAAPGATPAIVPHTVASVWNRFDVTRHLGVGLGVVRQSDMYAAVDNRVTLGGFTRADAAAFLTLHTRTRVQVNVENIFDAKYFVTADNDNNITPGSPRALRVSLVTSF